MSRHGNPARIDVLPFLEPFHDGEQVVGIILQRDALAAAAALPDTAFVVAQHEKSLIGESARELREDRDTGDDLIAIDRARPGDQHDGGEPESSDARSAWSACLPG